MIKSILFTPILFITIFSVFSAQPFAASEDTQLIDGKRLFWAGDYKQATKKIEEVLAKNPSNAEAHYFRGYLYQREDPAYQRENPGRQIPEITWEMTERVSAEFEQVVRLEPDYSGEIIMLRPREKIMSEWSGLALAYLYAGNIEKAKIAFEEAKKRGGLVPEIYEFMKNMLLSCPQDAVLITCGDMDTFFPLYLQVMEGLRTDVTILNIYLCQTPWFLTMITKHLPWQKQPLKLPFSGNELKHVDKLLEGYQKPFDATVSRPGCSNQNDVMTLNITPTVQTDGKTHVLLNDLVFLNLLKENDRRPLCMRYVRNPADAEDVVQSVFVKAWHSLDGFQNQSCHFTWLYRIGVNECLNYLKRHRKETLEFKESQWPVDSSEEFSISERHELWKRVTSALSRKERLII